MLARGAIDAGCEFFAAYPTPTTSTLCGEVMAGLLRRQRAAVNAPDEAAALAWAVGASARGSKAMVATSGPGWSRMIDAVEYAVAAELPVVAVVVEQLGPTGSGGESHGAQGDLLLAENSVSGGFTLPMFAPSTGQDCYEVMTAAFYWAERLRTPVVVLCDRDVAATIEDVADGPDGLGAFPPGARVRGHANTDDPLRPYAFGSAEDVSPFWPIGGAVRTTITGASHDMRGRSGRSSDETISVLRHIEQKITTHADEMAMVRVEGDSEADTLIVSFGVTARVAIDTVRLARARGHRVALATVLSLFPVPESRLRHVSERARRVIVAEENLTGQYRQRLVPIFGGNRVFGVTSVGRRITARQILEAIEEAEWKVEYV